MRGPERDGEGEGAWEGEGSAPSRKLRLKGGWILSPEGVMGMMQTEPRSKKSGSDKNLRCQGTAPRLGTASGPQDSGEAGMQKLLRGKKQKTKTKARGA